jgi:hypothetical protein
VENQIDYPGAEVVKYDQDYKRKFVDVYLIGRPVPQGQISQWVEEIKQGRDMEDVNLRIHQGSDQSSEIAQQLTSDVRAGILEDLYVRNQQIVEDKDARIRLLEQELVRHRASGIPFQTISREAKINYRNIEQLSYANNIVTDFSRTDTVPTFNVRWNKSLSNQLRQSEMEKLREWLQVRLSLDTISVQAIN